MPSRPAQWRAIASTASSPARPRCVACAASTCSRTSCPASRWDGWSSPTTSRRSPSSCRATGPGTSRGSASRSRPERWRDPKRPRPHPARRSDRVRRRGGPGHRGRDHRGGRQRVADGRAARRPGQLRAARAQLERTGRLGAPRHAGASVHRGRRCDDRPPRRRSRLHGEGRRPHWHRGRGPRRRPRRGRCSGRRRRAGAAGQGRAGRLARDGSASQAGAPDERRRARGHQAERARLHRVVAPRLQEVAVQGPPEDVLLRSAAALRRMGARRTRYDAEALTLEARRRTFGIATVIRIAARENGEATRLEVERRRGHRPCRGCGLHANAGLAAAWRTFLRPGRQTGELRLVCADATVRDVEYPATAHFLHNRHLAVLRDVSDRKQEEIERAELLSRQKRRLLETETLLTVSRTLSATLDPTETMRRVAREIARALGADLVGAFLAGPNGDDLRPVAGYRVPQHMREAFQQFPIPIKNHAAIEGAWGARRAVWTDDMAANPRVDRESFNRFPHQSDLFVPICIKERPVGGFFVIWWTERRSITDDEVRLVQGISDLAGMFLDNAQLYRAAAEANRAKDEFLATLSHEQIGRASCRE